MKFICLAGALVGSFVSLVSAKVVRVEVPREGLAKVSAAAVSAAIESAAGRLQAGDALLLPQAEFGVVDMPALPKGVQILDGTGGVMRLQGHLDGVIFEGGDYALDALSKGANLTNFYLLNATASGVQLGNLDKGYVVNIASGEKKGAAEYNYRDGLKIDGQVKDLTILRMSYGAEGRAHGSPPMMDMDFKGSGSGVKILFLLEHNQGGQTQALNLRNANGVQFAHGSTESSSSNHPLPLYEIINSENVYIGHRRFYSGRGSYPDGTNLTSLIDVWQQKCRQRGCWEGWPAVTLGFHGGQNNVIDNVVGLGNPAHYSLVIQEPGTQVWSYISEKLHWVNKEDTVSLEEIVTKNKGPWFYPNLQHDYFKSEKTGHGVFAYSMIENSFGDEIPYSDDTWREPRLIDRELVLGYFTPTGDTIDLTQAGAAGACIPTEPPSYPKAEINVAPVAKITANLSRDATFGAALIAAGADATGKVAADEIFAKVLEKEGVLEIPAGKFLLERGIDVSRVRGSSLKVRGVGMGKSVLVGRGAGKYYRRASLAKRAGAEVIFRSFSVDKKNVTIDAKGAEYAVNTMAINDKYHNVEFKNYTKAGIGWLNMAQKLDSVGNATGKWDKVSKMEAEQWAFTGCKFSGGEYGFRYDGYSDKGLFFNNRFENHSKGGIYMTNAVHFHGGVYQSVFENINGPGVYIGGGSANPGYGTWVFAVDNNQFIECGSAERAAVDLGYNWLGVLAHSNITTNSKSIFAGFKGNFAILEDLNVNVNSGSGHTMYLGHQQFESTAGIGGARLKNVTTNGAIKFMSRQEAMADDPDYPTNNRYLTRYPDMYADKPNAFHYLLYQVKSSNINEEYAIYKGGAKWIDVKALLPNNQECSSTPDVPGSLEPIQNSILRPSARPKVVYDMSGKKIMTIQPGKSIPSLPSGIHFIREVGTGRIEKIPSSF